MKKTLGEVLPKNSFVRGVGVLVGGTAGAQLIALFAAPILTRLFTPEHFGLLAVYLGVISVLAVIVSFRYELAIPLPESEEDVVALTVLSLVLVFLVSAITGFCLYMTGDSLAVLLGVPELAPYLWLVPLGLLFAGILQVLTYRAVRAKSFDVLAKVKITQQIAIALIQISSFKIGSLGLLVGQASGQGVGILSLYRAMISKESWATLRPEKIREVAYRYQKFPLFSMWAGLLNAAGSQMPPILFASLFGASAVGFYALAHRVIALPMGIVGQAVGQVFLANAAVDYRDGKLPELVISAQRTLIKVVTPPVALLIVLGPSAFQYIFGAGWILAGEVASWLALWMLVSFSTSPLSSVFTVVERQGLGLLMQALLFLVRLLGVGLGFYNQDFMVGVIWFSIFSVFGYLIYQIVVFVTIGLTFNDCLSSYLAASLVVILSFIFKEYANDFLMGAFFVVSIIFCFFYYINLLKAIGK